MDDPRFDDLLDSLIEVGQKLSQAMVRDGEGATKFITITVEDAKNEAEALKVAYAVAHSPLVKQPFLLPTLTSGVSWPRSGTPRFRIWTQRKFLFGWTMS